MKHFYFEVFPPHISIIVFLFLSFDFFNKLEIPVSKLTWNTISFL